jgi:hypothetical protein
MRIFEQLVLLVDKQKAPYLYKTTSSLNFCIEVTQMPLVAMATMTFQDG